MTKMEYMPKALKVATLSYLESLLHTVDSVVPFLLLESFHSQLSSACKNLWMRNSLPSHHMAALLAAMADHGVRDCPDEWLPPQAVLGVDNNRAALTMILSVENVLFSFSKEYSMTPRSGQLLCNNVTLTEAKTSVRARSQMQSVNSSGCGLITLETWT